MAALRITGIQMAVAPKKSANLPRILEYIDSSDCDFIVFPEMSLTGYNDGFSKGPTQEAWEKIAGACRASYVTAIVGTGSRTNGKVHIQSRIFDDQGEVLGTYEKLVPTETDRKWCAPGSTLRDFRHNNLSFGCLIGNDLWVAPGHGPYADRRLSYQLGQKGVQLIFHCNHSGVDARYAAYHDSNLRLRAEESGCYIVTVNAAPEGAPLNAPSGVVSPRGEWLVQCPLEGEHVFSYDLEME